MSIFIHLLSSHFSPLSTYHVSHVFLCPLILCVFYSLSLDLFVFSARASRARYTRCKCRLRVFIAFALGNLKVQKSACCNRHRVYSSARKRRKYVTNQQRVMFVTVLRIISSSFNLKSFSKIFHSRVRSVESLTFFSSKVAQK